MEATHKNLAKRTHETLVGMSTKDSLTGLLNRKGWDLRVSDFLKHANRTGEKVAFITADLDNLKAVNDSQGHKAGDKLLLEFSNAMRSTARGSDILARIGGDEFAFCLPDTSLDEAEILKDRLIKTAGDIKISVGIGSNLNNADIGMYKMKIEHRNNHD